MSKKFFSLIHSDETIHLAPGTRILSADAISKLLSVEEMLAHVEKDADTYKKEAVRECEILKEQAQKEGFEEGFQQWTQHIAELETEISRVHDEVHKVVVPLALKAAKKIVGREIDLKPETTVEIVAGSLKSISQHKKVVIYVNPQELETIQANKEALRQKFERLESLSIRPRDDIQEGGCVIETEMGIINAQLENQWQVLEKAFATLTEQQS